MWLNKYKTKQKPCMLSGLDNYGRLSFWFCSNIYVSCFNMKQAIILASMKP